MQTLLRIPMALLFLVGCGLSETKPSAEDYQKQFAIMIPAYFQVQAFDIEASENVGTKVEPSFKARFKASIKLKTETYEIADHKEEATLIRRVAKEGEKKEIYGIANAELYGGHWKIDYAFENNPIPAMGQPRDFFTDARVIVVGSPEEAEFNSQVQKRILEKQEAERRAVEDRRLAEERVKEERRLAEERAQAERRVTEERAKEERRKMLAEARRLIPGTWQWAGIQKSLSTYRQDGTASLVFREFTEVRCTGTWSIEGEVFEAFWRECDSKLYNMKHPAMYRIIEITPSRFKIEALPDGKQSEASRVK